MALRPLLPLARLVSCVLLTSATACTSSTPLYTAPDRAPEDRAPRTALCDEIDPVRCLLPWPSSRFLKTDADTATGLRVAADPTTIGLSGGIENLQAADGFSRVTPLVVGVPALIDPQADEVVALYVAEPGHPDFGREIPLRVHVFQEGFVDREESLLVAYPRVPMPGNAAMVAVVKTGVLAPNRATEVALDLAEPMDQSEADLQGYHAPTRALLAEVGPPLGEVARVWDFVTRSSEQPWRRLRAMRELAVAKGQEGYEVEITNVEVAPFATCAAIVRGNLLGLPRFDDSLPSDTEPSVIGTQETPFRIIVPEGAGDYRVVLYGHGLSGSVDDSTFDREFMARGAAKLNTTFYGWNEEDVFATLDGLSDPFLGIGVAASQLMQALADMSGMLAGVSTSLDAALSGPTLGGMPNPLEGRHPDVSVPIYGGASLGGAAGLTYAFLESDLDHAVLNVPGAAWSHFANFSQFFAPVKALNRITLEGDLNVILLLSMTQTLWDEVDGAVWTDARPTNPPVILLQESIGDPVLPNIGTDIAARATGAVLVGNAIAPIELGPPQTLVTGRTAMTQFRTPETDALDIHGMAARDTLAGEAAREQIFHFFDTAANGEAETKLPSACEAKGDCDFGE